MAERTEQELREMRKELLEKHKVVMKEYYELYSMLLKYCTIKSRAVRIFEGPLKSKMEFFRVILEDLSPSEFRHVTRIDRLSEKYFGEVQDATSKEGL